MTSGFASRGVGWARASDGEGELWESMAGGAIGVRAAAPRPQVSLAVEELRDHRNDRLGAVEQEQGAATLHKMKDRIRDNPLQDSAVHARHHGIVGSGHDQRRALDATRQWERRCGGDRVAWGRPCRDRTGSSNAWVSPESRALMACRELSRGHMTSMPGRAVEQRSGGGSPRPAPARRPTRPPGRRHVRSANGAALRLRSRQSPASTTASAMSWIRPYPAHQRQSTVDRASAGAPVPTSPCSRRCPSGAAAAARLRTSGFGCDGGRPGSARPREQGSHR